MNKQSDTLCNKCGRDFCPEVDCEEEVCARKQSDKTESGELRKVVCHASGDRCHACDHYYGRADTCKFAPTTSKAIDEIFNHEFLDPPSGEASDLAKEIVKEAIASPDNVIDSNDLNHLLIVLSALPSNESVSREWLEELRQFHVDAAKSAKSRARMKRNLNAGNADHIDAECSKHISRIAEITQVLERRK